MWELPSQKKKHPNFYTHQDVGLVFYFRDAVEKLYCMDDAFKKQVEAIVEAHHAEIVHLENEKQKYIDSANLKVLSVNCTWLSLLNCYS